MRDMPVDILKLIEKQSAMVKAFGPRWLKGSQVSDVLGRLDELKQDHIRQQQVSAEMPPCLAKHPEGCEKAG